MHYTGRRKVVTDYEVITKENLRDAVAGAMQWHDLNSDDERFLIDYLRGLQPVYNRHKEVRPDITHNTVVNHASEIVAFKSSYLLSSPITYISRKDGTDLSDMVNRFNDYNYLAGRSATDKELADDLHICGCAYRMIYPNNRYDGNNSPFIINTLNPVTTFVAYKNSSAKNSEPVFAGTYVQKNGAGRVYDIYTADRHFVMTDDETQPIEEEANPIGEIPIIEYVHNEYRIGAFEPVIDLLNDMNVLESNRIEATEQNVQSLLWMNDIELGPEEVEALKSNPSSIIFTRTVKGQTSPSINPVVVDLQQADQQVLANDLYKKILSIVGMPSVGDGNTSDSSNNGSTIVRNGWQHAEARAKETETLWRRSDKRFITAALAIIRGMVDPDFSLHEADITGQFTRRNYEDISTRSTVLTTLLGCDKVHPKQAYAVCGLFPDVEEAVQDGLEWYEEQRQRAQEQLEREAAMRREENGNENRPDEDA